MRNKFLSTMSAVALTALLTISSLQAADAPEGYVDFGTFTPVQGSQFVEVNIPKNLIEILTSLTKTNEPEVSETLKGLQQVRVLVLGLNEENRQDIQKRVQDIRSGLDKNGWSRVVTVLQDKQDVGIYLKARNAEAVSGVVVTVLQDNEQAVLINVVGDIRPEKLALIGERFNIDPLKKLPAQKKSDNE